MRVVLSWPLIFFVDTTSNFFKHWWFSIGFKCFIYQFNTVDDKVNPIPPATLSPIHNLIKLISTDWKNGFMLLTVDTWNNPPEERDSYQPRYLLKEVWSQAMFTWAIGSRTFGSCRLVNCSTCKSSDENLAYTFIDYMYTCQGHKHALANQTCGKKWLVAFSFGRE